MEIKNIFDKVIALQKIAWRGDDLMEQEDLCELQDKLATLALELAREVGETGKLVKDFPWLYSVRGA